MPVDFTKLSPKTSVGGPDEEHEEGFIFSQSQHVVGDTDNYYVTMMLNRNFRIYKKSDSTIIDPEFDFEVDLCAGMCFLGDNELLVADSSGSKVVICDRSTGVLKKEFISDLAAPNSIACDKEGSIFVGCVGDSGKGVKLFTADGNEAKMVTDKCANYVTCDTPRNRIFVTDTDSNCVYVYSSENNEFNLVFTIANEDKKHKDGSRTVIDPELLSPAGTAVDQHGNIFVCGSGNNRVHVYDKDGNFQAYLGSEELFTYPMDVFVNSDNELIVLDGDIFIGWSRLQIFEY